MKCKNCSFEDKSEDKVKIGKKHQKQIIKFGKSEGAQRYYCRKCGQTFSDNTKENSYERNTRKVVALLLNMLENDFFNQKDLKEAIKLTDKYYEGIRKINFITKYADKEGNFDITCYNPKLLICEDDKNISFIQIAPAKFSKDNQERHICIKDQKGQENLRVFENQHIQP